MGWQQLFKKGKGTLPNYKKQAYGLYGPLSSYVEGTKICTNCQQSFIFSAKEQQYWYEQLKFNLKSSPKNCSPCRPVTPFFFLVHHIKISDNLCEQAQFSIITDNPLKTVIRMQQTCAQQIVRLVYGHIKMTVVERSIDFFATFDTVVQDGF